MNSIGSKILVGVVTAFLLVGCKSAEQRNIYERGILDIAAQNHGWLLPRAGRVEIFALDPANASASNGFPSRVNSLNGVSYHHIARQKTITGQEASEFRKKWKSMTFWWGFSALCHEPAYGLRFFNGKTLLLETTFCWKCSNFEVPTPVGYRYMGFDSDKPQAKAFWTLLQGHIPLTESAGNSGLRH